MWCAVARVRKFLRAIQVQSVVSGCHFLTTARVEVGYSIYKTGWRGRRSWWKRHIANPMALQKTPNSKRLQNNFVIVHQENKRDGNLARVTHC
jgi:hypothetical protein